jgi:hypothetical protein
LASHRQVGAAGICCVTVMPCYQDVVAVDVTIDEVLILCKSPGKLPLRGAKETLSPQVRPATRNSVMKAENPIVFFSPNCRNLHELPMSRRRVASHLLVRGKPN